MSEFQLAFDQESHQKPSQAAPSFSQVQHSSASLMYSIPEQWNLHFKANKLRHLRLGAHLRHVSYFCIILV